VCEEELNDEDLEDLEKKFMYSSDSQKAIILDNVLNQLDAEEDRVRTSSIKVTNARRRLEESKVRLEEKIEGHKEVLKDLDDFVLRCSSILLKEKCTWNQNYFRLEAIKRERNSCKVFSTEEGDEELGSLQNWVDEQRYNFKLQPRNIRADRVQLLESLGFDWDPLGDRWNEMFDMLKSCE